ncbi:uncharacterized protein LOC135492695 [Lineus longissimus]|uniref:uncharacterized protein LOC135492695 n=1 Tax=Lineus longissimus TaxID=88925 RepID=UPI00315D5130
MFHCEEERKESAEPGEIIDAPRPMASMAESDDVYRCAEPVMNIDDGASRGVTFGEVPPTPTSVSPGRRPLSGLEDTITLADGDAKTRTTKIKKEIKMLTEDEVKEHRQKMLYKINSYCIPCIKNKFLSVPESTELNMEQFATDMEFREALLYIRNSYINALKHQPIGLRNTLRNDIALALVDADIMPVYNQILELFFKLDFVDGEGKLVKKYFNPVAHVMITLFNFTDKTEEFTRAICRTPGLLELVVWFLREKREAHFSKEIDKQVDKIVKASLSTLYNCSRVSDNRQRLLEVGAFETGSAYLDSKYPSYQMSALFLIAYLSDEEKSHVFAARKPLLEKLVNNLTAALEREDRQYMGWSALELIKGIDVLARNDTNKRLVVECGAFDSLMKAMRREDLPTEQLESTKTIWTLCFNKDNKAQMADDADAMDWFETVAADPDHQCRKMAKGILWTVTQISAYEPGNTVVFEEMVAKRRPSTADINDVQHIMISYQWDVQPLMIRIKDMLKSHGYKIWMDVEHMQGSTLSAMADAIEQSSAVIVAMSQKYKNSQNCRVEGEYAFTKGKRIIPLIVEPKYKPDGWLGLILGAKLYYNFSRGEAFEATMENLMRGLGNQGKIGHSMPQRHPSITITPESSVLVPNEHAAPPQRPPPQPIFEAASPKSDIEAWGSANVEKWMDDNGINRSHISNLTGRHLLFFQEMKRTAPDFYYKYIRRLFTGKLPMEELDALSSFSAAIEKL